MDVRHVCLALVCVSCGTSHPSAVTLKTAAASSSVVPVAAPTRACEVAFETAKRLPIAAELDRLAPQYFHAGGREGFNDLVPGTSRYRWYDPTNLEAAVDAPAGWSMIRRSTPSFFFGWTAAGVLHVARRDGAASAPLPVSRSDLDAIEDEHGAWVLASDHDTVQLVRVRPSLESTSWERGVGTSSEVDRRVAVTSSGRAAVLWVMRTIAGLELEVSWLGPSGFEPSMTIDRVSLDDDAAILSLRSLVELSAATEGDGIAVAWRPLAPKGRVDVGSQSAPPSHAVDAEVRIVTVEPGRASTPPRAHATVAETLDFTSGIGPWPLEGNGMIGSSVRGHAYFAWIDRGHVVAATARGAPHEIAKGAPRLLTRKTRDGEELLMLSVSEQLVAPVSCR